MPREKSSKKLIPAFHDESKNWVMLIQSKMLQNNAENKTLDVVKLKHPRTGIGAMFLFSPDNSTIHEIFCFSDKRSWFINDTVKEIGNIYLSTPIDPLFFVLSILKKSKNEGKVLPLRDLLFDQSYPERLLKTVVQTVHLIGERKGPEELNAWSYVEEKTMNWLIQKVEKVARVLKEKQISMSGSATSKNFIKSMKGSSLDDINMYLKDAHGLVSEYLTDDLSLKLFTKLNIPEEMNENHKNKRKSSRNEEKASKRVKIKEEEKEMEDVMKQDKPKVLNAKEKAMKKAAYGSKSITSFFRKT